MASLDNFPRSEAAQRMLSYVTQHWYDNSYVGKWVYEVMGREVDTAVDISEALALQFDIYTVTWGMKYWERMYGLPVKPSLDIEERRKLVLAKMSPHEASTPYWMEKELSEASGYTVNVYDKTDPGPYSFDHPNTFMVVLSDDSEMDFDHTRAVIENMKQSHTLYDLSYLPIVMDLIGQEKIVPRLTMRMPLKWWEGKLLNGEYLLDGSTDLSQLYPQIFQEMAHRLTILHDEEMSFINPAHRWFLENLERIAVSDTYRMQFIWWDGKKLDGEYLLDGATNLEQLMPQIFNELAYRISVQHEDEIDLSTAYQLQMNLSEALSNRETYRIPLIWWTFATLDGSQMLDGAIAMAEYDASEFKQLTLRQPVEAEEDIGVYIKYSADDAALDGLNTLGGTLYLNSRREEL